MVTVDFSRSQKPVDRARRERIEKGKQSWGQHRRTHQSIVRQSFLRRYAAKKDLAGGNVELEMVPHEQHQDRAEDGNDDAGRVKLCAFFRTEDQVSD